MRRGLRTRIRSVIFLVGIVRLLVVDQEAYVDRFEKNAEGAGEFTRALLADVHALERMLQTPGTFETGVCWTVVVAATGGE